MVEKNEKMVNQQFALIFEQLKKEGKVESKSDIAEQLGTYPHVINSILKGERGLTVEQINRLVDRYAINANFLLGKSTQMYNSKGLEEFIDIVENKKYSEIEVKGFVPAVISLLKNPLTSVQTEVYLDKLIDEIPDFYNHPLATFILGFYEKYIGGKNDKTKAINLAEKIITHSKDKASYAFVTLLRICRLINDYSVVDKLFNQKLNFRAKKSFGTLYELTFYYHYKNDTDNVEANIKTMLTNFVGNKTVLRTAQSLAVRFGLYEQNEHLFKKALTPINENDIDKVYSLEYESMLNSYEKAMSSAILADLTQGIAHEFGQPVTNIRFNIQYHNMLFEADQNQMVEKSIVKQIFEDILKQTERIGSLVDSLSPISSKKAVVSSFSLKNALQNVLNQERVRMEALSIHASIEVEEGIDSVEFDSIQFNQIITNLVINAIDSIEEKKAAVGNTFNGEIHIIAKKEHNGYLISISDNGVGIKEEDRVRMFNPFYTTKAPGKGQGLGLYIVSNLLRMHSGSIKLDNNYKQGAKFDIFILKAKNV